MNQTLKKGFTLIELLVVIAIIALLSTLAVVSLNNARAKARDATRVSDIKQMQTALELYFADQQGYPGAAATPGSANADCLGNSTAGFVSAASCGTTKYMEKVPANQTPVASGWTNYTYATAGTLTNNFASSYELVFGLEGIAGSFGSGGHTAQPSGIQ